LASGHQTNHGCNRGCVAEVGPIDPCNRPKSNISNNTHRPSPSPSPSLSPSSLKWYKSRVRNSGVQYSPLWGSRYQPIRKAVNSTPHAPCIFWVYHEDSDEISTLEAQLSSPHTCCSCALCGLRENDSGRDPIP
jgi:hypothetical protein